MTNGPQRAVDAMPRIALVDLLRALALTNMTVFHFVWDLEFFGIVEPHTTDMALWRSFAATIAGTFLFVSGASLWLANSRQIPWPRWGRRFAILVVAATAITLVTRIVTPAEYIRFGILHMIAAASVLGLAFMRSPWWVTAVSAATIIAIDQFVSWRSDSVYLFWTGFGRNEFAASDFRPVLPWLAPSVLGIAVAQLCHRAGWLKMLASWQPESILARALQSLGRRSLIYYLIHQPILFGLIWMGLRVFE
ncbi:MAG: heparan-alpha-glucosaminide N-acetyltransferase [Rhodobacteraceae bacterium]|nr:heparan-alpha-glucosaminide N-acetyltransferase [Paracoccaceae bacterium]